MRSRGKPRPIQRHPDGVGEPIVEYATNGNHVVYADDTIVNLSVFNLHLDVLRGVFNISGRANTRHLCSSMRITAIFCISEEIREDGVQVLTAFLASWGFRQLGRHHACELGDGIRQAAQNGAVGLQGLAVRPQLRRCAGNSVGDDAQLALHIFTRRGEGRHIGSYLINLNSLGGCACGSRARGSGLRGRSTTTTQRSTARFR